MVPAKYYKNGPVNIEITLHWEGNNKVVEALKLSTMKVI